MPRKPQDDYVTTAEAAARLNVTRRWVQILIRAGDLPSYQPGRRMVLIPRPAFEEYLRTRHRSQPEKPRAKRAPARRREAPPPPPPPPPPPGPGPRRAGIDLMDLERRIFGESISPIAGGFDDE